MDDQSHSEVKKTENVQNVQNVQDVQNVQNVLDSSVRVPFWKKHEKLVLTMIVIGAFLAVALVAIANAAMTTALGYLMPNQMAQIIAKSIPLVLAVAFIVGGSLFLKPKPLSSAERDRFYSLTGETPEEMRELMGFNLRLGNREKANYWAGKLLQPSKDEVKRIE